MISFWRRSWYQATGGRTEEQFPFGVVNLAGIAGGGGELGSLYFTLLRWYGALPLWARGHSMGERVGVEVRLRARRLAVRKSSFFTNGAAVSL